MEPLILLGAAIVAGAVFAARYVARRRAAAVLAPALPGAGNPPSEPATAPEVQAPDDRAELYRLSEEIETFVEKSAHPRELIAHPPFKRAVAILAKPDIPLETLRQYATGA
ncbi:MAG TPA: hypothetical protein VIF40_12850, partial [Methylosinus sp.]|uniref:hypothetical protein n=1 Tax=Methylosinus sp. TaxID=427 RepID=UPI002F9261FB